MATTTCVECGRIAPTKKPDELKELGWRVIVNPLENENVPRWRCGACWQTFKDMTGMPSLPPPEPKKK